MIGIPSELLILLNQTLLACEEFDDREHLRAVFNDARVAWWLSGLRFVNSRWAQIDAVVSYLHNRFDAEGRNALALFVKVMADRRVVMQDEKMRIQLEALAEQLQKCLGETLQSGLAQEDTENPEANVAKAPMTPISNIKVLSTYVHCVAKLKVQQYVNGKQVMGNISFGTGWLIAEGLLITCRHVIHARRKGQPVAAEVDISAQGATLSATFDNFRPLEGVSYRALGLVQMSKERSLLDYAIVRLDDRVDARLKDRGFLPVDPNVPLMPQSKLAILQHPLGDSQMHHNGWLTREVDSSGRILYSTSTEQGSSGGPVLDETNMRVVAMHWGNRGAVNEGILLRYILQNIQLENETLFQEIKECQPALAGLIKNSSLPLNQGLTDN